MKSIILIVFLVYANLVLSIRRFPNLYGTIESKKVTGDPGEPLLLTPLIEQNRINEALTASEVNFTQFGDIKSYSGYLTVDKVHDSNLFFWFFPAIEDYDNAPVLLWLQGGPGAPSIFGLFRENGPFNLTSGSDVELRSATWTRTHSVMYIDNPVGTGFSFTNNEGYADNQTKVGEDLYGALQQFFILFPNLRKNDFFITGESYAGKYAPAIAYTILKKDPEADLKINLKGVAIGNGLSDPEHQLLYGDHLYQLGLVDSNTKRSFEALEKQFAKLIQEKKFVEALDVLNLMLNGGEISLFWNATGFVNVYNLLHDVDAEGAIRDTYLADFLARADFRAAIHVGNTEFGDGNVWTHLYHDIPKSVAPWISELLENYRVLIYNGQMDLMVSYAYTVNFLQHLQYSSAEEYRTAQRYQWYVGEDLAGYVKQAGKLTEVMVRNAGHLVPGEQPEWALELISKFVRNQPLHMKL